MTEFRSRGLRLNHQFHQFHHLENTQGKIKNNVTIMYKYNTYIMYKIYNYILYILYYIFHIHNI